MPHFFISYRRSDREGNILAHMLFRELRRRYGEDSAFLDVDSRSPGLSFPVKVERALRVTDVVLVIIGPAWLQTLTERLGESLDWVRYEVAESLKRSELPVVPVCLAGVEMPRSHQLPEELKDLSSRDGVILDPCEDFESHLVRLLSDLENVLEAARREKEEELRREAAVKLSAEREAKEKAAADEREAKWAAAADAAELAAQEAARAKAAAAERAATQAASQKKAEPEPKRVYEAPASRLKPLPPTPSRLSPGPGPSAPSSGAPAVPRPTSPPAASSPVKAPAAKYYQFNHHFTIAGLFLGWLGSGLMIFPLALGYSYSLLNLPFVQANFVLTLLYGLLTGVVTGFALRWSKVENLGLTFLVGFVAGLSAVHMSWAVWFYGRVYAPSELFKSAGLLPLWDLATSPAHLWHLVRGIAETGSWVIWGYNPTGGILWLLWSLEAVLITGLSTFFAALTADTGDVFCEACHTRCRYVGVAKLRYHDPVELKQRLEAKDLAFLKVLGAAPSGANKWLHLSLYRCGKCGATNTLNAYVKTVTTDSEGRRRTSFASALLGLLVSAAECAEIQRIGREAAGSPKR